MFIYEMFTDVGVQRWDVFLREENSPVGNHLAPKDTPHSEAGSSGRLQGFSATLG